MHKLEFDLLDAAPHAILQLFRPRRLCGFYTSPTALRIVKNEIWIYAKAI
jgi:hypothetical protein